MADFKSQSWLPAAWTASTHKKKLKLIQNCYTESFCLRLHRLLQAVLLTALFTRSTSTLSTNTQCMSGGQSWCELQTTMPCCSEFIPARYSYHWTIIAPPLPYHHPLQPPARQTFITEQLLSPPDKVTTEQLLIPPFPPSRPRDKQLPQQLLSTPSPPSPPPRDKQVSLNNYCPLPLPPHPTRHETNRCHWTIIVPPSPPPHPARQTGITEQLLFPPPRETNRCHWTIIVPPPPPPSHPARQSPLNNDCPPSPLPIIVVSLTVEFQNI